MKYITINKHKRKIVSFEFAMHSFNFLSAAVIISATNESVIKRLSKNLDVHSRTIF